MSPLGDPQYSDTVAESAPSTARAATPGAERGDGLRAAFVERRLAVRTMDGPLKLATAATFASLLGAATLVALRDVPAGSVALGATAGVQTTLSVPLFAATLVLLSLGLGYVAAAAMFAARWVAVGSMVLITGLVAWQTGLLGVRGLVAVMPGWATALCWTLLAVIWALTLAAQLWPQLAARGGRLRLPLIVASCAAFGGFFLVLALASTIIDGLSIFPLSVHALMTDIALVSIPFLQIAAVDFAEWGQLSGAGLAHIVGVHGQERNRRARWREAAVPAVLCVILIVVGWIALPEGTLTRLALVGEAVLVLAVMLVMLLVVGRLVRVPRTTWPRSIGFAALFAVMAASTWAGTAVTAALSGAFAAPPPPPVSLEGDYTPAANVHSYIGISGFSVLVQAGWSAERKNSIDQISTLYPPRTQTVLFAFEAPQTLTPAQVAAGLKLRTDTASRRDGRWQRLQITSAGAGEQSIWTTPVTPGSRSFVFYGMVTRGDVAARMRDLEAIVRSFRASGPPATLADVVPGHEASISAAVAAAQQRQAELVDTIGIAFDLLVSMASLVLLVVFRRRWPVGARLAVLLFGMITAVTILVSGGSVLHLLLPAARTWPGLGEDRLLIGVGLFGIVALAAGARRGALWARRLPAALTALSAAVLVLYVMDLVYTGALSAGKVPVWAAVLILVAIGWDIVASGESLTNRSSARLPRATRVLAFFGYAILLAGTIVYFSGQHSALSTGPSAESFFEPEAITQAALFRVALPVMVLLFLLQLFGAPPRRRAA